VQALHCPWHQMHLRLPTKETRSPQPVSLAFSTTAPPSFMSSTTPCFIRVHPVSLHSTPPLSAPSCYPTILHLYDHLVQSASIFQSQILILFESVYASWFFRCSAALHHLLHGSPVPAFFILSLHGVSALQGRHSRTPSSDSLAYLVLFSLFRRFSAHGHIISYSFFWTFSLVSYGIIL
jgi:hypothetical protein